MEGTSKKIELIEDTNGSWFWAVMKWSDEDKSWYNASCGTGRTYELASEAALAMHSAL